MASGRGRGGDPDAVSTNVTPSSAYRADIDGLRALAVLAVVGYHAFPGWVPGGFVGVDVFFVISGFLITSIIVDDMARGRFSFGGFYARRIRRIFPALAVVLAASLLAGWWLLDPDDYTALGRQALASAAFVPNLLFWRESGYFDTASELKPLLHLWSLGVEEQFYLAWPLLLTAAWKLRMPLRWVVAALSLASFAACLWLQHGDPVGAFFLPHARVWELGVGGLLAVALPARAAQGAIAIARWRGPAAWSGLLLVTAACFWLDAGDAFPGPWALLPTLGAALLVAAGPSTRLSQWLSWRPLVWVGLVSYPLYLWHWPMLAIARLAWPEDMQVAVRAGLVLASVGLAGATWRWVERPIRGGATRRWKVVAPLPAMALVAAVGLALALGRGAPGRVAVDLQPYADFRYDVGEGARMGECWLGARQPADGYAADCIEGAPGDTRPLLVVWGDSHAARLAVGMREIAGARFRTGSFARDGCPPLFALKPAACVEANAAVLARIRAQRPEVVVLFAFWASPTLADRAAALQALDDTVSATLDAGARHVVVVGPTPQWDGLERTLPKNLLRLHAEQPFLRAPARTTFGLNPLAAELDLFYRAHFVRRAGVTYFSARDAFCNPRGCLTRAGDDPYDLVTWDYGHLTTSGAIHVARALQQALAARQAPAAG